MQYLANSEEAQICILHNLFELWNTHQQMMCVLIDKLLKTQVVECSAVATWIFSREMNSEFTKMYLWEILHLTIKKMNKHVIKLGKMRPRNFFFVLNKKKNDYILGSELNEAKEKISRADSSSSDSEDEGMTKRKKIEATDKPTEEVFYFKFVCFDIKFFSINFVFIDG